MPKSCHMIKISAFESPAFLIIKHLKGSMKKDLVFIMLKKMFHLLIANILLLGTNYENCNTEIEQVLESKYTS